ncbi:hypothetical protein [Plantactinospora sonchi]|uniref:Uncharacterized protein n=1 Tax=Plantactinospora sonchi TaxID=1544735 RepID=A0ABU7RM88_9ACTN
MNDLPPLSDRSEEAELARAQAAYEKAKRDLAALRDKPPSDRPRSSRFTGPVGLAADGSPLPPIPPEEQARRAERRRRAVQERDEALARRADAIRRREEEQRREQAEAERPEGGTPPAIGRATPPNQP